MKAHVKYARARDQLYHLKVAFRELCEGTDTKHPTPELRQTLDIIQTIINTSCDSFERGHILEVLINEYVPTTLPGFEDMIEEDRHKTHYDEE